jgi:hypothetical protein
MRQIQNTLDQANKKFIRTLFILNYHNKNLKEHNGKYQIEKFYIKYGFIVMEAKKLN